MKFELKFVLVVIFTVFESFGGFGPSTLIKATKEQVNFGKVLKKSMSFSMLYKKKCPFAITSYQNFTKATSFPYYKKVRVPTPKVITLKQQESEMLIGIKFTKEHNDSFDFDIICDPLQIFYGGESYSDCFPIMAKLLKEGDSLICVAGEDIKAKKIKKFYKIYNDKASVLIPESKEALWIPVSTFGVISYNSPMVSIEEEGKLE